MAAAYGDRTDLGQGLVLEVVSDALDVDLVVYEHLFTTTGQGQPRELKRIRLPRATLDDSFTPALDASILFGLKSDIGQGLVVERTSADGDMSISIYRNLYTTTGSGEPALLKQVTISETTAATAVAAVESGPPTEPPSGLAARFIFANSDRLNGPSDPSKDIFFDQSYHIAFWYRPTADNPAGTRSVVRMGPAATSIKNINNALVYSQETDFGDANTLTHQTPLVADTWYFVEVEVDVPGLLMTSWINGVECTTPLSLAGKTVTADSSAGWSFGASPFGDFDICLVGGWQEATGHQSTVFLGSKKYADLTAGEKVDLVNWYDMGEASGDRADSHGTDNLTDVTSVGSVAI